MFWRKFERKREEPIKSNSEVTDEDADSYEETEPLLSTPVRIYSEGVPIKRAVAKDSGSTNYTYAGALAASVIFPPAAPFILAAVGAHAAYGAITDKGYDSIPDGDQSCGPASSFNK